jgi:hypothetical protein
MTDIPVPDAEPHMSVEFDEETGKCTVTFRGEHYVLPVRYETAGEAIQAGKEFCRGMGWEG